MFRLSIRELTLAVLIVSISLAWWCDRWLAENETRNIHELAHKQLLDKLQSEVQRAADESGVTIRVEAAGLIIVGRPTTHAAQ